MQAKPTKGETSRDKPTSLALAQFIPPRKFPEFITEFINPTPMIDPINVCELEAGNPRYQVPRFQVIAEIKSEKTIANPAADPTFITSSTGSRLITPKATAPVEVSTPIKFHRPDQITATHGGRLWV